MRTTQNEPRTQASTRSQLALYSGFTTDYAMPGMPIRRKMIADIKAAGGLEAVVFDELRNGETLNSIAKTFDVGRSVLWRYLKKDPARYAKYEEAARDGAAGMADKGQQLLEQAATHVKHDPSAHVQATRHRAQYLQWHAGVMDRKTFGAPDKSPQVQISIEHLHLSALQALGSPESQELIVSQPTPLLEPVDPLDDAVEAEN